MLTNVVIIELTIAEVVHFAFCKGQTHIHLHCTFSLYSFFWNPKDIICHTCSRFTNKNYPWKEIKMFPTHIFAKNTKHVCVFFIVFLFYFLIAEFDEKNKVVLFSTSRHTPNSPCTWVFQVPDHRRSSTLGLKLQNYGFHQTKGILQYMEIFYIFVS